MNIANAGRELLVCLKAIAGRGPVLCLPVGQPCQALLRPVATSPDSLNQHDIRCLTQWRNHHVKSFLTEFETNDARTGNWLVKTIGPSDTRILFMVDDLAGGTIGYMGLGFINWDTRYGEADAIVRGAAAPHGLMTNCLRSLLAWGRESLGLRHLAVRVRSDNSALQFYQKLGFREMKRVPLRRTRTADMIVWVEDPVLASAEVSLVYLDLPEGQIPLAGSHSNKPSYD